MQLQPPKSQHPANGRRQYVPYLVGVLNENAGQASTVQWAHRRTHVRRRMAGRGPVREKYLGRGPRWGWGMLGALETGRRCAYDGGKLLLPHVRSVALAHS